MRTFLLTLLTTLMLGSAAFAQRNVAPVLDRDPLMEADAKHNLDVAKQGFSPLKKAYKQVLERFEETYVAYPEFSQMDEFLYMAGMSSWYLSQGKGHQKIDPKTEKSPEKYTPEHLRANAVAYLTEIVDKHPDSKFKDDAQKALKQLGSK
ncbi:MAG TPA: outer membrane protein assembly factor BamD [Pyrinomonadaceae bacterium]|nr:outer membrane protein assembly factor BamD [Pyrinomonadaceae bacterium]